MKFSLFFVHFCPQNLICCSSDVLEGKGVVQVSITVSELLRFHSPNSVKSPLKIATNKSINSSSISNGSPSPTKANTTITAMLTSP